MGDNNDDTTTNTDKQLPTLDTATSQSAVDLDQGEHIVTTPVHLPIQAPSRNRKPLIWTLAIVIVLLLIGGGTLYFMTTTKSADETPVASISPSPVAKKALAAQDIVAAIKALTHTGTLATITKSDAISGQTGDGTYVYHAYPYQMATRKFATDPSIAYGTGTTGDTTAATADFSAFKTYLTNNGFTEAKEKTTVSDPTSIASMRYTSPAVFCHLDQYDYSKSVDKTAKFRQSLVGLSCADVASYDSVAKPIDPIYQALVANAKSGIISPDGYIPYLGTLTFIDGIDGYKTAAVDLSYVGAPFGVGKELLYQEPGKGWASWMITQDALNCADLTTTVLKKAFAAQDCYDLKTNKTMKASTLL